MKKQNFPLIMVHIALMLGSLVFYLVCNSNATGGVANFIDIMLTVIAYISGVLYLIFGFKKEYAVFYKLFMIALLAETAFSIVRNFIAGGQPSIFMLVIDIITLAMIVILAFVKDIGRTKAILFAIILIICKLVPMIIAIVQSHDLAEISRSIAGFLLAGTTAILVTEKYLDKADRGTN